MHQVVMNVELDKRTNMWDNVLVTGEYAQVSGIKERIEDECKSYLAASETSHESQSKDISFLKVILINFRFQSTLSRIKIKRVFLRFSVVVLFLKLCLLIQRIILQRLIIMSLGQKY